MDDWRIVAWIGERTRPRVQRLAPPPSVLKLLFANGNVFGDGAAATDAKQWPGFPNGTRGADAPRSLAQAYRRDWA